MVTAFLIRVYDNVKNNLKLHKCCEAKVRYDKAETRKDTTR